MAELLDKKSLESELGFNVFDRRIQNVQCIDRWTKGCQNRECTAFKNENGDYYCIRKDMP